MRKLIVKLSAAAMIVGGTGAYVGVHGYGTLRPTATGSDVTLHLTR